MIDDVFLLDSVPMELDSSFDMIFNAADEFNNDLHNISMDLDDSQYFPLLSPRIDDNYAFSLDQQTITNDFQNTSEENNDFISMKLSNEDTDSLHGKKDNKKIKRGKNLPTELTQFLKRWIYQNWKNPYPSKNLKDTIAKKYGVSTKQISTYLINARIRLLQDIEFQHKHRAGRVKESQQRHFLIPIHIN